MSLPPIAVPKSAAAAGTGPGPGPSPSSQLRATLTSIALPGSPVTPQAPAVPPPQIPRIQPALEDRLFSTQPGVAAVYSVSVPRPPGPPYTTHDIPKGHPNLAGTPPGHGSSPGLSQVLVSTAHLYRYLKSWESDRGSLYASGQNAAAQLVYSPPTQPMNAQPQSRPFGAGPRTSHHQGGFRPIQFFQRTQMQTVRPSIPSSSPSIRPGSQTPTAAVYPPNQPIMMTMTPMPFPSPQAAQYYIPQYRHSTPQYVGAPQQYSVQPPGPSTFYPNPGPAEFPTPYAGPPYYPGQPVYTPSPPIIVPTPQQPPPTKREKKTIRIRDPNQGGRDITEEIMSGGGSGSRNPTPPVGRPFSTPTPPQQLGGHAPDHGPVGYSVDSAPHPSATAVDLKADEKPKQDPAPPLKPPSPGLQPLDPPAEKSDPPPPVKPPEPPFSAATAPPNTGPAPAPSASPGKPTAPVEPAEPAVNGLTDKEAASLSCELEAPPTESIRPSSPPPSQPLAPPPGAPSIDALEAVSREARAESAPAPPEVISAFSAVPVVSLPSASLLSTPAFAATSATASAAVLAPPPGLTLPPQGVSALGVVQARRHSLGTESKDDPPRAGGEAEVVPDRTGDPQPLSNPSPVLVQAASTAPKTWKKPKDVSPVGEAPTEERQEALLGEECGDKPHPHPREPEHRSTPSPSPEESQDPPLPEENGEQEAEPLRNGAENASETESSDSGVTPGESSAVQPNDVFQEEPVETDGKKQYNRDFLLSFQFMPACVQKPDGLPPIADVVLDKINQNKLPMRSVDSRVISRGPDFTPAFADFGRQSSGGRGAPLINVGLRRPPPRKIIMNISVNDEVQLKKAENAWKPGMKREGVADAPDTNRTQDLFRKVRSILNKLTPQMFNQLMKQVTDLTIDTEERLKGVIDLVFEKAIDEPGFSVAYGNMCRCLATLKVPMADKPNSTVNFRKLLLNRCQKEFERDKVDDDVFERKQKELESAASSTEREHLQEELEEAKDKARRRSIGNIKFIGELFKLKMLTEAIMHDCVVKLLKNHDQESLECLCRLLTTIGKDLDFEKAKPRMDQYFNQMEKIVKERKTSSRIRFMLQDVIDLRLHNWVSRRADQGPKTIEQIHKEAKIEEQEEQRKVHQQLLSKDNKRRPVVQREETWSTVPMTKNSRTIDPTKIPKISKPTIDDKIQLGPRAQINWVKGSSGGAGAKAIESDLTRSGGSNLNRYSALQSATPPQTAASTPSMPPDFDSRRSVSSRSSSGRERSEKLAGSAAARTAPFPRGGNVKERPESPAPTDPRRPAPEPADPPKHPSAPEEKAEPDRGRARDSAVKSEAPDKPLLSEEDMEKKSKAIIDEFLHINDYKEAVQCVEELDQASQLSVFVRVGVESTLERSQITRDHMGHLLFLLLQSGTLSKSQYFKGFSETLELADDMAIDIPHIWLYLAEQLTPMLREGGISMRDLFCEFSKPLLPVGRAGILFSEILHLLCKQMSHRKVGCLWRESGLSWEDFLPESEDVLSFISDHKLDFTMSDCSSPEEALSKTALSPDELIRHLEKLLLEDMAGDEQIFDWVEANLDESQMSSPPFLRALMTSVCKAAVTGDSSSSRALIVKLDQPPNLLRMFFDCLYDEDVISEDAFYKWENSKDPRGEQLGKGVALKSVTTFFMWLREAEEESEDN
ncbi:hypothetical protein SKAU_G00425000 [Synaphobranchus kaupii]|uniref:Eukaryotic translation initiation factor 4 gamma 3 n=1 Tax=Synaphobranchus kaupii TaxID=118154 RepID=A0A9Q1E5P7_SYNKA|nr:hypothetical protein SKAU_G00425000 [Synaphobranchus kaupii]